MGDVVQRCHSYSPTKHMKHNGEFTYYIMYSQKVCIYVEPRILNLLAVSIRLNDVL